MKIITLVLDESRLKVYYDGKIDKYSFSETTLTFDDLELFLKNLFKELGVDRVYDVYDRPRQVGEALINGRCEIKVESK